MLYPSYIHMNRITLSLLFSLFSHTGSCAEFTDLDADGIPDSIEILYGTDYQVPDSHYDLDDDNYSNLKEFYFNSDINWSGSIPGSSIDRDFLVNNDRSLYYISYSEDWRIEGNEQGDIKLATEVDSASIEFRTAVKLNSIVTFTIESEAESLQVNTDSADVELEEISIPSDGIGTYSYAIVNGSSTNLNIQKANKADFRIFFTNDSLKEFSIAMLRIYEDRDGDGSPDSEDNCPTVPNQDQSDSNLDGAGDSCEPKTGDTDGDTISDHEDNCPDTANYSQSDWDSDTIGDACDDDIDGDLLINELEILYGQEIFSRNGYLVDFPEPSFTLNNENYDGDLLPDRFEYLMGTDPFSKTATGEKIDLYDYFPVGNISWELTDINDTLYSPVMINMEGSNGLYHCNNTYFPLLGTNSSSLLVKEDGIYVSDYEVDDDFSRAVKVTIDNGYEIKVLPRFLSIGQFFHYSIPCEQTSVLVNKTGHINLLISRNLPAINHRS
jgi:hypothetical protein